MSLQQMLFMAAASSSAASAYDAVVLADSPLSYWKLGETSGTNAAALGSNPQAGIYTGTYTLNVPGLINGDSDGAVGLSNGYVNLGAPTALNKSRSFSLEVWFKQTSTALGALLSFHDGGYYMRMNASGKIEFLKSATASIGSGATTLASATKHHSVVTMDASGNWVIYADGVSDSSGSTTTTFSGVNLQIGQDRPAGTPEAFVGTIDAVAIYGSALSSTRVAAHHTAGA